MIAVQPFLTAYDPSDLPGSSVDPLGFERGYLFLADKILPGLTNVANRPRYFSALCAAIWISDDRAHNVDSETPRARYQRRLDAVQRLERFWTLACVLASEADPNLDSGGIRGISYARAAATRIAERGDTSTAAEFRLLSRQLTYGMVGIYASVADGLGFVARDTLALGPDLGRRVAEAFVTETDVPGPVRTAVAEGGSVGVSSLRSWGARAHLQAAAPASEAQVLQEALDANDTRRRMAELLRQTPSTENETELRRFNRIRQGLATTEQEVDIREALDAILAYEDCYRLVLLVFLRLLWFCQTQEPFTIDFDRAASDSVVREVCSRLPAAWARLDTNLVQATTGAFQRDLDKLNDVRACLQTAAHASSAGALVEWVLDRHRDVQHAKVDGGRRKMPWVELVGRKIAPTLSVAQSVGSEPKTVEQVAAHPYRTIAADRLYQAGRRA